jgi:hypothetical protein
MFAAMVLATDTTIIDSVGANEHSFDGWVNAIFGVLATFGIGCGIFYNKIKAIFGEVNRIRHLMELFAGGVKSFLDKYYFKLQPDMKKDLTEMVITPLDNLLETMADSADKYNLKSLAKKLRDVIKIN